MAKAVSTISAKDMLVRFRLKTLLVAYFNLLKCVNRTRGPIKIIEPELIIIFFSAFPHRGSHLTHQMEHFLNLLDLNQQDDGKETERD